MLAVERNPTWFQSQRQHGQTNPGREGDLCGLRRKNPGQPTLERHVPFGKNAATGFRVDYRPVSSVRVRGNRIVKAVPLPGLLSTRIRP